MKQEVFLFWMLASVCSVNIGAKLKIIQEIIFNYEAWLCLRKCTATVLLYTLCSLRLKLSILVFLKRTFILPPPATFYMLLLGTKCRCLVHAHYKRALVSVTKAIQSVAEGRRSWKSSSCQKPSSSLVKSLPWAARSRRLLKVRCLHS